MQIVECASWQVGPYVVHCRPRFDSPAWPQYLVFLGERLIGRQFSQPSVSDCEWLERQARQPQKCELHVGRYGRPAQFNVSTCKNCGTRYKNGRNGLCLPCARR